MPVGSSGVARFCCSVLRVGHAWSMPDVVNQLLATEVALDKLGARGISTAEAEQAIWNRHVVIRNRRGEQSAASERCAGF